MRIISGCPSRHFPCSATFVCPGSCRGRSLAGIRHAKDCRHFLRNELGLSSHGRPTKHPAVDLAEGAPDRRVDVDVGERPHACLWLMNSAEAAGTLKSRARRNLSSVKLFLSSSLHVNLSPVDASTVSVF